MNVAFFGTSDKSTPILEKLNEDFNLVLCVTKADTLVGRKQEKRQTEVKKWAKEHKIRCTEVEKLDDETAQKVVRALKSEKVKVGIVADFDYIIPPVIYESIPYGLVNIHFSLLPKYRGASPIQHAILNREEVTGISYLLIDEGMDTGDILFQVKFGLTGHENTQELYDTLFEIAGNYLPEVLNRFASGLVEPQKQDNKESTYCVSPSHPRSTYLYKEDAQINWGTSLDEIYAQIRAYYPWPVAWTTLSDMGGAKLTVSMDGICEKGSNGDGTFRFVPKSEKEMRIKIYRAVKESTCLKILEIQPEGKKIMSWKDFINGYAKLGS